MILLQIIPGTANFYCGGCIRDTALFRALQRMGHTVILQPLYLPLFSDEPDIENQAPVFFGGVNVYLQQKMRFFQKTPHWIDRAFDSRWLLNLSAKQAGMTNASELGEMTISMMLGDKGRQAKEYQRFMIWLKEQPKPDAVILPNGMLLGLANTIKKEMDIPILCTLQGEDSFLDTLPEPYATEAWHIFAKQTEYADALIPVSYYYAREMKERLNLNSQKCMPVQNGISLDGFGEMKAISNELTLGFFARMCKEKGLDILVEAFIHLKRKSLFQSLKLKIAGTATNADKPFIAQIKDRLKETSLLNDVEFHPNVNREEKIRFLKSLSVLSVPALYGECFGLYVIESMAAGTPVVQPNHAGFPEIIKKTNGGLLFDPENYESYISALESLLLNPDEARRLGSEGRENVHKYFSVDRMARDVLQVLESVQQRRKPVGIKQQAVMSLVS